MIVGLILVGIMLGGAAGAGALLLGTSIWIALLIYTIIGSASVLGLAVIVALKLESKDQAEQYEPFVLANPERG